MYTVVFQITLTLRSCHEALMGRPFISTRKPVPRPLKVGGAGGGPLSLAPLDISTRNRLPKKSYPSRPRAAS